MRAFVALELPPEAVGQIERILGTLKGPVSAAAASKTKIRWVRPSQAHLTLRFLGEVTPKQVEAIIDNLEKDLLPRHSTLQLGFGRGGAFPSLAKARVLWVALEGSTERLLEIAGIAEAAAQRGGVEPSTRQFRPHVTLARIQPPINVTSPLRSLRGNRDMWPGRVVSLIRSDLTKKGPEYTRLAQFDLEAGRMIE